jgi:hypothetical protein
MKLGTINVSDKALYNCDLAERTNLVPDPLDWVQKEELTHIAAC